MWRFITVTFAFMFWAFYELSGGADYKPAVGSLQHAASVQGTEIPSSPSTSPRQPSAAGPVQGAHIVLASASAVQQRADRAAMAAPSSDAEKRRHLLHDGGTTAPITAPGVATVAADPAKIARLVAAASAARAPEPQTAGADPDDSGAAAVSGRDMRTVRPARVNLRSGPGTDFSVAAKLSRGTRVEILRDEGDGWVKLRVEESGRIGWMADYLLVAAN